MLCSACPATCTPIWPPWRQIRTVLPKFSNSLVNGSILKSFYFKCKNYSWLKDLTHYYWPVPTNYTCLTEIKRQMLQLSLDDNTPFSTFYIWGDICEVKSKLSLVPQNKNKMPTFQKATKAPLPSGDRQKMYRCCYFTAT